MSAEYKDPYQEVHVQWRHPTYMQGASGGMYFPPHEAGTPSLSEPLPRVIAQQICDAEPENYVIYEDTDAYAQEQRTQEESASPAPDQSALTVERQYVQPQVPGVGTITVTPSDPYVLAVTPMQEQTKVPETGQAETAAEMDAGEDEEHDAELEAAFPDDDGDDRPPRKGPIAVYDSTLKRPQTREQALEILGLNTAGQYSKKEIADAYAARQQERPASRFPDHYAQITDAYNLLVPTTPPAPVSVPAPVQESAPAQAPPPPRPQRKPRAT